MIVLSQLSAMLSVLCFWPLLLSFSGPIAGPPLLQAISETTDGQIITLVLKVSKEGPDTIENFSLVKAVLGKGTLKRTVLPPAEGRVVFVFELADREGKVLETLRLEDPVRRRFEYVNDDGNLHTLTLETGDNVFAIRANYHPDIAILRFGRAAGARVSLLQSIPLSLD